MSKIKIGILYICTGRCDVFWDGFYKASEHYIFTNSDKFEKHYFIYTDSQNIKKCSNSNIIPIKYLGYPYDTLMRFHDFLVNETDLLDMDYIYYFNANSRALTNISEDILPENDEMFVGVQHPLYNNKKCNNIDRYPFERNYKSTAYISYDDIRLKNYLCGALIGGIADKFIEMCKVLKANIDIDLSNNIIARINDESYYNWYMLNHKCKQLSPDYDYIEDFKYSKDYKCKILILNKKRFGGLNYLRYTDIKSDNRKFF